MAKWSQLTFQDAASPIMSQLISFHDHAMLVLTLVTSVVSMALISLTMNKLSSRMMSEAQQIETIWTILPAIVLQFLALPSLRLLYLMDEITSPSLTIKAIGHQWYWSYQYSDFNTLMFDSYMITTNDLIEGELRLLEVDNRVIIPMNIETRMLTTSTDVIHAWTVPSLGVKSDAVPGRLNQMGFMVNRPGIFYGQCSEICGANHSFMPIALEAIDYKAFLNWASTNSS